MATNSYNKTNSFNIDLLNVEDFIIKYNSVTYLSLEVIFNSDIQQIINKYSVVISLVNPNDTSIVYAQFTPSSSDFGVTKNTIPTNGGLSSYTQQLGYFTLRYINKNHFKLNNAMLTTNTPAEGSVMQLRVTINGVSKLYGTRNFNIFNNSSMSALSTIFNYKQNYNLATKGYYYQNTDKAIVKINNVNSVVMSLNSINNFNVSSPPLRTNVIDFTYTSTAQASYSGTNSYALTKNYNITSNNTKSILYVRKGIVDRRLTSSPNYLTSLVVGSSKLFDTTLKNASAVTDTVYLEMPLFSGLSSSGLIITSVSVTSSPNKVNFSSLPVITALGLGKFKIDLSYAPTGEPNATVASYTATITINLSHPVVGLITINSSGFTYTNSTG